MAPFNIGIIYMRIKFEPPTKFSKRGGLTGSQFLEGVAWKEKVTFFMGGCSFYIKNKLKSEIYNNKQSL